MKGFKEGNMMENGQEILIIPLVCCLVHMSEELRVYQRTRQTRFLTFTTYTLTSWGDTDNHQVNKIISDSKFLLERGLFQIGQLMTPWRRCYLN